MSMVAFHFCYDLKFIAGKPLDWFAPPLQDIWRASISWTFLFIAGCMCSFSRNNIRRALKYGAVALAIYVATSVAAVDDPISFGIIFCDASCTLVVGLLDRANLVPKSPPIAALFLACFLVMLPLAQGRIGIGPLCVTLPSSWYETPWLSWLGLPGPGFVSGDYYPVLPYLFLYLCGTSMGWWWKQTGYPEFMLTLRCAPLEFVGRHALPIYVIHQPVLLLLCAALG